MNNMKQKILSLLVLLLTAASGAWAEEEVLLTTVTATGLNESSQSPDGMVTVTVNMNDYFGAAWGWGQSDGTGTITVEAAEGYTITRCVFKHNPSSTPNRVLTDDLAPFVMTVYADMSADVFNAYVDNSGGRQNGPYGMNGASVIEVYGTAAPTGPEVTQVPNTTDEWQFTMPAGNVLVDVEYKDLTAMALTFGGKAIPEAGVKGFLGFEQEFIDGLNLDAAVTNTDQNGAAVTTDATSYTYTSSDATVIGFKTATEGVYELSGALADMVFRQEGSATLTIQYAGTEDLGKSAETALLVTVTEKTYTVELADNTADADNWQGKIGDNGTYAALPVEGLKGSEKVVLKYDGSRIVKRVTATVEGAAPAGPKTYTELKGGEVLHVGDILDFSDPNVQYVFNGYTLKQLNCPYTVLRANITGLAFDPTVTPADDGAYYVIKDKGGDYYFTGKNLPATATSDGLLITINSEDGNYRYCSASVHEP